MKSSNDQIEVVKNFADAWVKKDLKTAMSHLTEDCVCNNAPIGVFHGKKDIGNYFQEVFNAVDNITYSFKSYSSADDNKVLTECTKCITEGDTTVELDQMVAFTLSGNKITGWNAYFDKDKLNALGKLRAVIS